MDFFQLQVVSCHHDAQTHRGNKVLTLPHCNTKISSIFQAIVKQNPLKSATVHWHMIWQLSRRQSSKTVSQQNCQSSKTVSLEGMMVKQGQKWKQSQNHKAKNPVRITKIKPTISTKIYIAIATLLWHHGAWGT